MNVLLSENLMQCMYDTLSQYNVINDNKLISKITIYNYRRIKNKVKKNWFI